MEKKYTIYKLIDPITNEIRYVGLTFNNLKQRLRSHMSDGHLTHKGNWVRKLKSIGLKPIIESIESDIDTLEQASEREVFYIEEYKKLGYDLTNANGGGHKNVIDSLETRLKKSNAAKKKKLFPCSEKTKERIRISAKIRFADINERERLSISNKKYEESKTEEQKLNDILIQKCIPVLQYDKDMNILNEFPSARDAARKTGIQRSNIVKCCQNKRKYKSAGGFIWKYK